MIGAADIQLAARYRTVADQRLIAAQVSLALVGLGGSIGDRRLALDDGRLGALALLQVVGQRGLLFNPALPTFITSQSSDRSPGEVGCLECDLHIKTCCNLVEHSTQRYFFAAVATRLRKTGLVTA